MKSSPFLSWRKWGSKKQIFWELILGVHLWSAHVICAMLGDMMLWRQMEKEMATHSRILAWRIPRTGEPGGLLSMGSHRVGHDWSDLEQQQQDISHLKGLGSEESALQHLWALALCCPLVPSGPPICLFPTTLRCTKLMDPLGVSWHPHPGGSHTKNARRHRFPCRKKQVSGRKEKLQCFSPALLPWERVDWLLSEATQLQFSSVAQSCPTLCNPINHSTPGLPVHHQLQEFTQTHIHRVGDAIQPSHPLPSPSPPAPNSSQHQGLFQWVNSSHQVAKILEFQLQYQSFQSNTQDWSPLGWTGRISWQSKGFKSLL